ncbi:zf-PARP type zinc finger protein, G1-S transition regulator Hpz1 [Schizosaccharomyces osmophilus]|uniref:Zf-PARP type zinc finger protein, G1-S transition regulator Hpz1 n=1 Tax=Schizosaccharomyces osmophilus TaxID=2545709 RepID=A0AAE9W958_9SCHI|nr:zf-PARP type zinc finger protein, G1-S transition regulator Hpz1 [Schizosaccharomyces osmophilus]WBW71112.1 zf-PARP type zinc finger protein, G1-S transition regulator Hpz1 [Schizosaccharomyces osmophilus]
MAEAGGGYRVEIAKTGRAGCKSNLCGRSKIERGQLRFGSFVDSGRFQSWMWRHWGCVTERVIQNVETKLEGNIVDNLDGFDEIEDEEVQQKVIRAFKQGHVDDEDVEASRSMAPEDDENEEEDTKEENLTTEEEEEPLEEVKGKRKRSTKTPSKKAEPKSSKKDAKKPKLEVVSDEEAEELKDDEEEDELLPENDDDDAEEDGADERDGSDSEEKSPKKTIASERPKRSTRAPVKYAESGEEYSDSD